jgi:hypothetical protein
MRRSPTLPLARSDTEDRGLGSTALASKQRSATDAYRPRMPRDYCSETGLLKELVPWLFARSADLSLWWSAAGVRDYLAERSRLG